MGASFTNAADQAIYAKLAADTTLTAMLAGGTASPSIYHAPAPAGAGTAFVVFQAQSPSRPSRTFGGVYKEDAVYQVKAVVQGGNQIAAGSIAARVDALLDGPPLTYAGFTHIGCERVQEIAYPETADGGIQYVHRGALYRLRAHA